MTVSRGVSAIMPKVDKKCAVGDDLLKPMGDTINTSTDVNKARGGLILAGGRVRSKKKKVQKKTPHPEHTTKAAASSPATATTSRRRAKKHVPRVSPYSPASIDTGFMEIGLVQLSQSVKRTNVVHT